MVKRTSLETAECPIARSLDALGDWWSLLIIRDALLGIRRFSEFQKSIGLAKNILTVRLRCAGGPRHPEDGAGLRRQRLSGICADPEGTRGFSGAGRAAAVERGIFLRGRWLRYPAGRSQQRPAGAEARTACRGRPVARAMAIRSSSQIRPLSGAGVSRPERSECALEAQLQRVFYNFSDSLSGRLGTLSTSVDLTGTPSPPMFAAKRPMRISRNRPLFSP